MKSLALYASAAALALASCATPPAADMDSYGPGPAAMAPIPDGAPVTPPQTVVSGPSPREAPPAAIAAAAQSRTPAPPRPDPDMQAVLDSLMTLAPPPIGSVTPAEQRMAPTPTDAVKLTLTRQGKPTAPVPGVVTMDKLYPGATGAPTPARIYRPEGATGPLPVVVYYHGGGWVIANLDVYDAAPRAMAKALNAVVISLSYRQAPEHKFPAAHDDANSGYRWTLANAASFGGDPTRVAVAGESAGGNLAANVAIAARNAGITQPRHMLLVYPVAQPDLNTPSYLRNAAAMPLGKAGMQWFFHYVPRTPADGRDPRINLVGADLAGLPPATIINAEIDPLLSDGEMLAARLRAAGVSVEQRTYDGVTHEFFGMAAVVRDAREAQEYGVGRLKAALR